MRAIINICLQELLLLFVFFKEHLALYKITEFVLQGGERKRSLYFHPTLLLCLSNDDDDDNNHYHYNNRRLAQD